MKLNDVFVRQQDNPGALLNIDSDGLNSYRETRRKILESQSKLDQINNINKEMNELKSEFNEIKQLLLKVLESK